MTDPEPHTDGAAAWRADGASVPPPMMDGAVPPEVGGPSPPCKYAFCESFESYGDGAAPGGGVWTRTASNIVVGSAHVARRSRSPSRSAADVHAATADLRSADREHFVVFDLDSACVSSSAASSTSARSRAWRSTRATSTAPPRARGTFGAARLLPRRWGALGRTSP